VEPPWSIHDPQGQAGLIVGKSDAARHHDDLRDESSLVTPACMTVTGGSRRAEIGGSNDVTQLVHPPLDRDAFRIGFSCPRPFLSVRSRLNIALRVCRG